MAFSVAGEFSLPRGCVGLFSGERGWIGEPRMVHDAHLYLLQFHAGSFRTSSWGRKALLFSVHLGIGKLSMGLEVQDVAGFDTD
jgi:hypothetical protein